jgi:hypothetical protein
MSAAHLNPEIGQDLWIFSTALTWGISPMGLGEKAHCRTVRVAGGFRSAGYKPTKYHWDNNLASLRKTDASKSVKARVVQKHR